MASESINKNSSRDKYGKWLDGVIDSLVSKRRTSTSPNKITKTTRMGSFRSPKSKFKSLTGSSPQEAKGMSPKDVIELCNNAKDLFLKQPMLLELSAPMTICGDLHGQYQDLFRIFDSNGFPPKSNYLFLGDYVDRGKQSVETACLLFALKLKYPENFFLLRGNHEAAGINRIYGFYDECKRKYSVKVYRQFCSTFDCLPCCAVIDNRIICMHGGLSPHLDRAAGVMNNEKYKGLEKIKHIQRPCDVPDEGLLCDLLWSDPDASIEHYDVNDRGVSYVFGRKVVSSFLRDNDLDLVVRAHQVVEDGYEFFAGRELVTIFSAPNYCGEFDNSGATMTVDESLMCSFQIMKPATSIKTRIGR